MQAKPLKIKENTNLIIFVRALLLFYFMQTYFVRTQLIY